MNCKTVTGPITATTTLKVLGGESGSALATAYVQCPWEIAVSELRICFVLLSMLCTGIGLWSVRNRNKEWAKMVRSFQPF